MISTCRRGYRCGIKPRYQHWALGLSVALAHTGPKNLYAFFEPVRRNRRSGKQEQSQTRIIKLADLRMLKESIERSRRQKQMSHPKPFDIRKNLARIEPRHHDVSSSQSKHRERYGTRCVR